MAADYGRIARLFADALVCVTRTRLLASEFMHSPAAVHYQLTGEDKRRLLTTATWPDCVTPFTELPD